MQRYKIPIRSIIRHTVIPDLVDRRSCCGILPVCPRRHNGSTSSLWYNFRISLELIVNMIENYNGVYASRIKKYMYKQIFEFVIFCHIEDISFLNYTMHVCHIQYIYTCTSLNTIYYLKFDVIRVHVPHLVPINCFLII